jgi:hypothetical protein
MLLEHYGTTDALGKRVLELANEHYDAMGVTDIEEVRALRSYLGEWVYLQLPEESGVFACPDCERKPSKVIVVFEEAKIEGRVEEEGKSE